MSSPALPGPQTPAADLRALAASLDTKVRRAVARHPNTPAQVLAVLGETYPAAVLSNPALPLLRLAEPGSIAAWPPATLAAMAGCPEAPLWLLRQALVGGRPEVARIVAAHPHLDGSLFQVLALSPWWSVRAAHPHLPVPLVQRLAADSDYGVRQVVAKRADLPADLLAGLGRDPHLLVRRAVQRRAWE